MNAFDQAKQAATIMTDHKYSVMVFDIDGFKDVNQNYGHSIGDLILNDIADSLKSVADSFNLIVGDTAATSLSSSIQAVGGVEKSRKDHLSRIRQLLQQAAE